MVLQTFQVCKAVQSTGMNVKQDQEHDATSGIDSK